ncbi:DNA-binding transcriptional ArsR family regulator [Chitinophaga dinghuensis]|uniref:DNA-binding transcriptional ArsR family regulator n=1 Tax=Chitinophaga dinghuensis TaxID=1539050 RepID=A0A327W5H0_9BACT|nr:metalloregulator ArsR/SmtB family transcription factor [Chitinophaga dinghuensis]RAJ83600.1 DNA-binding transcriptional ArsR family regulator [Chitinophaga dinghuensis]
MKIRRDVFHALADPTRRIILSLVALQAMTPGAIAEKFDTARQTISKHIQILTECELLTQTQTGREIFYQLNLKKLKEVGDWLDPYRKMWEGRFDAIEDLLDEMQTKETKRKK